MSDERDRLDIEVRKLAELEKQVAELTAAASLKRGSTDCEDALLRAGMTISSLRRQVEALDKNWAEERVERKKLITANAQLESEKAECAEALRQAEYAHVTRLEICDDLRHKLATAKESLREALSALSHAKMFIEYARYELEPGLATIGDQFPRQEDADKEIKNIDAAIEKLKRTEGK